VVVILRDGKRADDCLRIGLGFLQAGARVQTIILRDPTRHRCPGLSTALKQLQQGGAEQFADNRIDANHYGLIYATLDQTAARLKSADLVISF
jgi:hypothetical protein